MPPNYPLRRYNVYHASIEWGGLKQVHKDVIAQVFGTHESLPNGRIFLCCKRMDLAMRFTKFNSPIECPFQSPQFDEIIAAELPYLRFENFSRENILDRVRQLIDFEIEFSALSH